jgi:hypothetical protein
LKKNAAIQPTSSPSRYGKWGRRQRIAAYREAEKLQNAEVDASFVWAI